MCTGMVPATGAEALAMLESAAGLQESALAFLPGVSPGSRIRPGPARQPSMRAGREIEVRPERAAGSSGVQACAPPPEDGVDPGEPGDSVATIAEAAHRADGLQCAPGEAEDGTAAVAGNDLPGALDLGYVAHIA